MTALRIISTIYKLIGYFSLFGAGVGFMVAMSNSSTAGALSLPFVGGIALAGVSSVAFAELVDFLFRLDENLNSYTTQLHIVETRLYNMTNAIDRQTAVLERIATATEKQQANGQLAEIARHTQATTMASERTAYSTEILASTVTNRRPQ